MMAYFLSEAQDAPAKKPSKVKPAVIGQLEGCSPMMAATFQYDEMALESDVDADADDIEFFDPLGQMDGAVKEALLKLAREERAE